jgi:N utilization substance protein A
VDPVGSCIGQRGTRVQAVLSEIGNEKIDIILYDKDTEKYIINALSPAKIESVKLKKYKKKKENYIGAAEVKVANDQLSLAIGREGQNVRLASKLVGWDLDVSKNEELNTESKPKGSTDIASSEKTQDEQVRENKKEVKEKSKKKKTKKDEE